MIKKVLKNKKGEVLKSKTTGKELYEYRLEAGDEFIPLFNDIIVSKKEAIVDGKKEEIENYNLKAKVRDKTGKKVIDIEGNEGIYITLTPAQARSLQKKIQDNVELNQHLFNAYIYDYEDKQYIGVGFKQKQAKGFDDFE